MVWHKLGWHARPPCEHKNLSSLQRNILLSLCSCLEGKTKNCKVLYPLSKYSIFGRTNLSLQCSRHNPTLSQGYNSASVVSQ